MTHSRRILFACVSRSQLTIVGVSYSIGSTHGPENITAKNTTGTGTYEWVHIGNTVFVIMARTIVNLADVCAITRILSIQMTDVAVSFPI